MNNILLKSHTHCHIHHRLKALLLDQFLHTLDMIDHHRSFQEIHLPIELANDYPQRRPKHSSSLSSKFNCKTTYISIRFRTSNRMFFKYLSKNNSINRTGIIFLRTKKKQENFMFSYIIILAYFCPFQYAR